MGTAKLKTGKNKKAPSFLNRAFTRAFNYSEEIPFEIIYFSQHPQQVQIGHPASSQQHEVHCSVGELFLLVMLLPAYTVAPASISEAAMPKTIFFIVIFLKLN